jgi:hypothetical protein
MDPEQIAATGQAGDRRRVRPSEPQRRGPASAPWLVLLATLAGCTALLPRGTEKTLQPWSSFSDAYSAIDRIVPYQTTRQALSEQKIDPAANPSITILSYTDLLQRLNAVAAVSPAHLERGIADCLNAGKRCTAYSIDVRNVETKRIGNFWLDLLSFHRRTRTTGWTFTGLIIFVDDLAVFALAGGQPNVKTEQVSRNPLGPIQGVGISISPGLP